MRQLRRGSIAAALAVAVLSPRAVAQEDAGVAGLRDFSSGAENAVNTRYVWRGIVVTEQPVMQPAMWVSLSNVTLGAWHNRALGERFHTTSLTLDYETSWKKLSIEPGVEAFWWSETGDVHGTVEGSILLSYEAGPLRVFTNHIFDVALYRGSYFGELGVGTEITLSDVSWLDVSAWAGWASSAFNEAYIGPRKAALNVAEATSALTHYVEPYLYVRPSLHFSYVTDAELRDQLWWPTIVDFGLAIGVEF